MKKYFRTRAIEWMLALVTLLWGIILLSPGTQFNSAAYRELSAWADETVWGWFCLILGLARLLALFVNGALRYSPIIRSSIAGVSFNFWIAVSLGFWDGGATTALAVYPMFALFDFLLACLIGIEAGQVAAQMREARKHGR